ncbi:stress-induced acidophilic repeat motif-containing protein [Legionella taurinensis]|nr:stress-induced acidophilic repeat motif-containing protein [Legionella taurinensis]
MVIFICFGNLILTIKKEIIMAGTSEGGKKAAETRGHESLSEAGRKGGQAADHKKAAETRGHDSLSEAGRKGGKNSHRKDEK